MIERDERLWRAIAGLSGFAAIVMDAVGSHAISDTHASQLVERASHYELIHAAVLLWLSGVQGKYIRAARWLFVAGTILFCGTLYLKALTGWEDASRPAPIGGISFMLGWLMITLQKRQK